MERQFPGRVHQCVLRWSGHVERMEEDCIAMEMISNVEGNRCRGGPKLGWMDGWMVKDDSGAG